MALILFGATGMLGQEISRQYQGSEQPFGPLKKVGRQHYDPLQADPFQADQHPDELLAALMAPGDVVINSMAYTDVPGAETHTAEAWAVNAHAVAAIARACAKAGAALIHISTDYVFGEREWGTPLPEDPPNPNWEPLNVYGASKLGGELALARIALGHNPPLGNFATGDAPGADDAALLGVDSAAAVVDSAASVVDASVVDYAAGAPRPIAPMVIARTSWLYQRPQPGGGDFVSKMFAAATDGQARSVVDDQRGCPSFVPELAGRILSLAGYLQEKGPVTVGEALAAAPGELASGLLVVHLCGGGEATWFDLARKTYELAGADPGLVTPASSDQWSSPVRRQHWSVLDTSRADRLLGAALPWWRALTQAMDE